VTVTGARSVITYEYTPGEAGGRVYSSSTVRLSNRPYTTGLVDKYPTGKKVTVHYNPHDPTVAFLELESTESLVGLCWGVAMELMGLVVIYFLIRRKSLPALVQTYLGKRASQAKE